MHPQPEKAPPADIGENWNVEQSTRRVQWGSPTVDCANCGTPFDTQSHHYYILLRSTGKRNGATEEMMYLFCRQRCRDTWL
jgi:endogenous inhibitor of DNA gyrase (YacG/DUF329 family)